MNDSHITRFRIARAIAALCLIAVLPATVSWAGINPQPFRTGLFGVITGQSIRVSILNAGEAGGTINPCVRVWDLEGNLLFETDAGPVSGLAGTFVDFTPPPSGAVVRTQVRAEVELVRAGRLPEPGLERTVHVTLEVFDTATGKTAYTTPFAAVAGIDPEPFLPIGGVDPQPFRTGLLGVTAGQSIRVSALNAGDIGGIINPCFRVLDLEGAVLFEVDAGPLPGGVGTFVDFTPPPSGASVRTQLRAEVELVPAVHPPAILRGEVVLNLEVFDIATGKTIYTMPPVPHRISLRFGFNPQPEPPEPGQHE